MRAGAVWAIDYTEPDAPLGGDARALLLVRDLASGRQLLVYAAERSDAETTVAGLRALFREHGPPLVLKSDNGGHFTAAAVVDLLEERGVRQLLSPPYTPAYNGSIEAGIGSFKRCADVVAARNGRAGVWTDGDLEEARLLLNDTVRPHGPRGATPNEAWRSREPIGDDERAAFRARAAAMGAELIAGGASPASASRDATRRALEEQGILEVRKERVRLPKRMLMRARIP